MSYTNVLIIGLVLIGGCSIMTDECMADCYDGKYGCTHWDSSRNVVYNCIGNTTEEIKIDCLNICMPERYR